MSKENIPIVASTGAASLLINGVTFNSYFGLGILTGGVNATVLSAMASRSVCERIVYTDTIIIDEISMISGETFTAANLLCQKVRQNKKPFGGIRVIAVGDFLQLGPYSDNDSTDWVFECDSWKNSKIKKVELTTIMRTKDKKFLEVLAKVRYGKIDAAVKNFLMKRTIKKDMADFEGPRIFSRNHQVDTFNHQKLSEIQSQLVSSKTLYVGDDAAELKKI